MELYEQADKIFNYIIIKNSPYIFDLNLESKSDSTNNINILNSNNNTLVTILVGSSDSLNSYRILGTPSSEPKNTELDNNLYLISSSGVMVTTECVTYGTWCERSPSHGMDRVGRIAHPAHLCSWVMTVISKSELA